MNTRNEEMFENTESLKVQPNFVAQMTGLHISDVIAVISDVSEDFADALEERCIKLVLAHIAETSDSKLLMVLSPDAPVEEKQSILRESLVCAYFDVEDMMLRTVRKELDSPNDVLSRAIDLRMPDLLVPYLDENRANDELWYGLRFSRGYIAQKFATTPEVVKIWLKRVNNNEVLLEIKAQR